MKRALRIVLLAVLGLTVLFFALVGVLTLVRDPAPARVRALGPGEGAPAADSVQFARTAALLTGTTLTAGNRIEPLLDGAGTFPRLWTDLRRARTSLHLQLYYITPGRLLDSLAAILAERAAAGVQVRFLYDDVGADLPDSTRALLVRSGVRLAVFRPVKWYSLHRAQNRSHARIVVVDGRVGYTGGFGVDDRWGAGGWRDTNVRLTGPVVEQLQASFAAAWAETTGRLLAGEGIFGPAPATAASGQRAAPEAEAAALAGLLHSVPTPGTTAGQTLVSITAAGARRRLWITNAYFVPTPELVAMLTGAARRGVDVRLLLPGTHTDVPPTRWAARAWYERLLSAGVRIYEYRPTMIHAKTMVADGQWVSVGTMNLDARSFVHNDELNVLAWDAGLAVALEQIFLADLRRSRAIELESFRRRSWRERLLERLARPMTKLL